MRRMAAWIGARAGPAALGFALMLAPGTGWGRAADAGPASSTPGALQLHRPSPDWRDQVLYFVMTDRFADGDPANNDQGAGEFRPGDASRYQGGDLAGLRQRLDYIGGLGATGLWITPPVANQWLDPAGAYSGYHGYWARDFMQVDPHLGTLDDYRRLSDALHRRGMVLVQDIVVNHTGNYFSYGPEWQPGQPVQGYRAHTGTPPAPQPTQPPFDLNDPRDPKALAAGIYHWTPDVRDYQDPAQEERFQMSGLDDLATDQPAVRRALRASYGHWIREVGVDAFRVDTAFYVQPDFFADFLHARDPLAPGVAEVARRTGRTDFLVFGEGFGIDPPGDDTQARKIERYMTGADGRPLLPGMLNFPLYGALGDAYARGRPPAELGERITRMTRLHARPHLMPSFVDNHDVDRFLAGGHEAGLRQALLALMTLPGIPVIYYGTEQGYTQQRASMFAAGWGSGGRDRYDASAPLYRDIAGMTALRRSHRVLSRGWPTVLHANAAAPGALAWRMDARAPGRAGVGSLLVVFNTADADSLMAAADTGLPAGSRLRGVHGLHGRPANLQVGAGGRLTLRLPARSGQVWRVERLGPPARATSPANRARAGTPPGVAAAGPTRPAGATPAVRAGRLGAALLTLDLPDGAVFEGDVAVGGRAEGLAAFQLVLDGDLARAQTVVPGADGRWQTTVDTAALVDPARRHRLVAWAEGQAVSAPAGFRVVRPWQTVLDVADPAGDDHGPEGRYTYPTAPGWAARQADLRRVQLETAGGALRLTLGLGAISTPWNPPNGFDHVAFTVYVELPGQPGGATVMPLQHGTLPQGMRWHLRLRAGGWSNALHGWEGADAQTEGRSLTPGAALAVDAKAGTVSFTLPAAVLGRLPSLAGAKVYVTTWDYDGGYRALAPQAAPFGFGGGAPEGLRVMDDIGPMTLP